MRYNINWYLCACDILFWEENVKLDNKFLMGNEAAALGAVHAGVNMVCGYPGTPSTEILEAVAKNNDNSVYVEWSVNEKAALEAGAGCAYAGGRVLVTMKQVGLNVASDPLMSLAYVGVKGGMVIAVADDPGPISSQTEQDTRNFAQFSKLPVFDPSSVQEAYDMMKDAFELSEKYGTPVIFRPTTRICHGYANIDVAESFRKHEPDGFVKDSKRWVIFPRLSYNNHIKIVERNEHLQDEFSEYKLNRIEGLNTAKKGIACSGISYEYVMEALGSFENVKIFKVSTPYPFPEKLAEQFLDGLDEVLVFEELDPVIEKELVYLCGKTGKNVKISGKLTHDTPVAGENSTDKTKEKLSEFLGIPYNESSLPTPPPMPQRPPVLCAGCPHRGSFYAVKQACKGRKAVFCGDIGCYTLGNAMPLDMTDTCLCMGADVTIAQGIHIAEPDTLCFAFIGDSTFFASGMTGVVNAVYNQNDIILVVLDNSTTAMTGHQPHPGTGHTMMGEVVQKVSIEKILDAVGVTKIVKANPLNYNESVSAVKAVADEKGVRAIIFKSPCIAVSRPEPSLHVDSEKCIGCMKCIKELGCPAVVTKNGKAFIEESLCFGCKLCAQVCPVSAIGGVER